MWRAAEPPPERVETDIGTTDGRKDHNI